MLHKDKVYVSETEMLLLALADDMASAAADFNSHNYSLFIQARDTFKQTLHESLVREFLQDHT